MGERSLRAWSICPDCCRPHPAGRGCPCHTPGEPSAIAPPEVAVRLRARDNPLRPSPMRRAAVYALYAVGVGLGLATVGVLLLGYFSVT